MSDSGFENMPQLIKELSRWRSLGRVLWPMVRLWPVSGACGTSDLHVVEELADLLGESGEVAVDTDQLALTVRRETIDEVVSYLQESGKIKRVNPTERESFLKGISELRDL